MFWVPHTNLCCYISAIYVESLNKAWEGVLIFLGGCDQSEESIHTGEDMKNSNRKLNLLKARCERLLEPEEIRRVRKKLHLSQEQAGVLIGGGPLAFQKYESGDLMPSRAISTALVLLDRDPAALSLLEVHRKAA